MPHVWVVCGWGLNDVRGNESADKRLDSTRSCGLQHVVCVCVCV